MSNLRRILTLRYALVVVAVYLLVILPLHVIPDVRDVWWILLAAFVFFLLIVIAISTWTEKTIMRQLESVRAAAERLAAGDFERRITSPGIKEFDTLARDFNGLGEEIRNRVAEAAAERGKLEAVLSNISTGVMVTDPQGRIIMLNPAAEGILGVEQKKAEGCRIIEVFSSRELDQAVARALQGESVEEEIQVIYPKRMIVRLKSNAVTDADHFVVVIVSTIEDVTALKRLNQVRQDFVANVSHELRTPVASIKALTDSLIDGAMEEEETAKLFLKDLEKEVNRLSQLIEDLLTLGRLEAKQTDLRVENIRASDLFRECVEAKTKLAEEYHIRLETRLAEDISFKGDHSLILSALNNLVDNAIKYNREGGGIYLSGGPGDHGITIEVADSGIGIPREELPRIFERFYRVDKARSRETGGTGLGLSIVKHVVELHGGIIEVDSVEGEGTNFTLHLPNIAY
jgi:two-component system phosphate regulon sensor histidine kinase PhoR